ncbi:MULTISPECIES: type II toxin-antitoxin system VapC family toxin [unclassified Neorhizobium]|uniref:type II toxin-antitoxin system VapC family toxin n=2 Tax=unclassified Neorhizobium TaxID=2629175 RepID=UPI001FF467DB|nr:MULTISPECIES: type II toxin-antitoxin system VapC family toxin [unclassified Neorhizobium]MCJ9673763.1 type II toxin-antitoxin system VapC family toxin [Neorhizobium sp. SHOUNA12B]MCJ9748812.1 type II toxin-antitoxin system VapC family toxin [Neorhizobium sp. SHOUNA12A]
MMRFMLDTNIVSAIVRDPRGKVFERLAEVGEQNVFISIITHGEVWYGVKKNGSEELARKVAAVTRRFYVAPLNLPVDQRYADIRQVLRQGKNIGPNDLWIAAHALALDAVLVTNNESEFSRVPGLKIENWLR